MVHSLARLQRELDEALAIKQKADESQQLRLSRTEGRLAAESRGATLLVALFPSQVAERAGVSPGQQAQGRRERTVAARTKTQNEHGRQCMLLHVKCFGASSFEAS